MEAVEKAYGLLKQVLGESNFQTMTTRLENRDYWVCMVAAGGTGMAGVKAFYMLIFKLDLGSEHVEYYVQYPTLPGRIKDEGFLRELAKCHGVHYKIEPVRGEGTEEIARRGDVWLQFGVGFPLTKMTPEYLEDLTRRLRMAIEDCYQLIPSIGAGPRTAAQLRGLFEQP